MTELVQNFKFEKRTTVPIFLHHLRGRGPEAVIEVGPSKMEGVWGVLLSRFVLISHYPILLLTENRLN